MSLSDIMSAMRLNLFAEAAFVLAAAGFLTVLVTLFLRANRAPFERARVGGEEIEGIGGGRLERGVTRADAR